MVAASPSSAWSSGSPTSGRRGRRRRGGVRRPAAAHRPPGGLVGHPPVVGRAAAAAAGGRAGRPHLRGAAGAVPGLRGQHRARRRALVQQRPGRRRGGRERRRTRAAAAGRGRTASTTSTAASSTRSRSAGPSSSAPTGCSCCRSAGSTGRSRRRSGRGRWRGSPSRSPGGTGSCASWPSCRTRVECHVLPARGTSAPRRHAARHPRLLRRTEPDRRDVRRLAGLPRRAPALSAAAAPAGAHRDRPSSAVTLLLWVLLPLWLVAAAALSPLLPAAGGRSGCSGSSSST